MDSCGNHQAVMQGVFKDKGITTTLLIPVLNEADALPKVLPHIDPDWVDQIVFVEGGSTDGTPQVIREWGHGIVIEQKVPGLSNGYWEAFPSVTSDVIIAFSPDGNSLPEAIPALIEKMRAGYDMVIASRYLNGARSEDDDPITAFGNWMFTRIINFLFGGRYTDCLVMLRAYRKALIEALSMDTRAPVFEQQLAIRCAVHKRRVAEIPASEPKRIGGVRKMKILINGWATVDLIVREWFRMRSLKQSGLL